MAKTVPLDAAQMVSLRFPPFAFEWLHSGEKPPEVADLVTPISPTHQMNVAHEVVVGRRFGAADATPVVEPPRAVDPTALLRPEHLMIGMHHHHEQTILSTTPSEDDEMDAGCSSTSNDDDQICEPTTIITAEEETTTTIITTTLPDSPKKKGHQRQCSSEDGIHYVDDDDGVEFQLDARHLNRVHEELEKLNIATDVINKLELQLDQARERFRAIHSEWSKRSDEIRKKYDNSIRKSRPYYEAVAEERKLRDQAQSAAIRFERANSMLQVAKQQVKLTQDSLTRQKNIEPECLEVLNHHVQRVNEAEHKRTEAGESHRALSAQMIAVQLRVKQMAKENARAIRKTRHYFDLHLDYRRRLDHQKQLISRLENEVKQKKRDYTSSLRNLEQISDSIHEERSLTSSAKHSARTPDSTRKSVSAVGLCKMSTTAGSSSGAADDADFDDFASSAGDLDEVEGLGSRGASMRGSHQSRLSSRRAASSLNGADSHSTTSSSSGGISIAMSHPDSLISDLCAGIPPSLVFDDDFDLAAAVEAEAADAAAAAQHHHHRPRRDSEASTSAAPNSAAAAATSPAALSPAGPTAERRSAAGVILLAQRLIGNSTSNDRHSSVDESYDEDVFYHTAPEGISSAPTASATTTDHPHSNNNAKPSDA